MFAQSLALVCVGNAHLRGRDVSGFWPDAGVFRFIKLCDFGADDASAPNGYRVLAADPLMWFENLKPRCRGLRLHTAPSQREPGQLGHIEERMLVGFVGGGPRWLIETVEEGRAELWQGFDRLLDRDDPAQKIWGTTYIQQGETTPQDAADANLDAASRDLAEALADIATFAKRAGTGWVENFEAARAIAAAEAPFRADDDLLAYADLDPKALRLLNAVAHGWVFGGMGSWNDIGVPAEFAEDYDRVSERLFRALIATITAAANSTFAP